MARTETAPAKSAAEQKRLGAGDTPGDYEEALKQLEALAQRAQEGDEKALPLVQELLKTRALVDAWGDLARHAQRTLVEKWSGRNLLHREALTRKLDLLRAEVGGPDPTPLERLLVERVVACWLHLHHLEALYAGKDNMGMDLATYYQRSIDRAHRRYLAAIKALALVRRLALPAVQVNIARKQVNIAALNGDGLAQGQPTAGKGTIGD